MKIIVTDDGRLWNAQSPILAQYAEEVIVISYYTDKPREHQVNYQYLDVKIPMMMGMDENGAMTSIRFRALCEVLLTTVKKMKEIVLHICLKINMQIKNLRINYCEKQF